MRILALDIGGGTQDLLLFDSALPPEGCFKLVMPAPTQIAAGAIRAATRRRQPVALGGVTMGGGAVTGALRAHLAAGLPAYATPPAARTCDDDLEAVAAMGVTIVAEEELAKLKDAAQITLRDLDWPALARAFAAFGLGLDCDALAVAALDHGEAHPGMSDRLFRFQHLRQTMEREPHLTALAYRPEGLPPYLTRLRAIAASAPPGLPLLLMDTGAAAALGALEDPAVRRHRARLHLNLGNMHTLGFLLGGESIFGLFEHHTGRMDSEKLAGLLEAFVSGRLTHKEVFADHGHGAFMLGEPPPHPFLAVTGPRRGLLADSKPCAASGLLGRPHFAVPHGDMMMAGCFGLVRALAWHYPAFREGIEKALDTQTRDY